MTLTSTGPSGFHLKPLVGVFAAAVFAAAAFAVGLWIGNERQPAPPAAVDAAAAVATPEVAPSANVEAFEAGKFDDAPLPPPSPTAGEPGSQGVATEAPSANVDAYAAGKLDLGLDAGFTEARRDGESALQITNRLKMPVELLLVFVAESLLERRVILHDRVENTPSPPLNQLEGEWV